MPASAAGSTRARRTKPSSRPDSSPATASSASCATLSTWRRSGRGASWRARRSRTRCSTRWCCGMTVVDDVRGVSDGDRSSKYHVDALAARMVTHPQTLDVIVASNLFGDILTDLGAAISGSLGLAPSGEHQPRAQVSVDVRTDPRIGAGHRRARALPIPSAPSGRAR